MADTNLSNNDAVQKIHEMATDKICMFSTFVNSRMVSRPMATLGIDADGSLWFFSDKASDKNEQLQNDDEVSLVYMDHSKSNYLSLHGIGRIVTDEYKAAKLWTPVAKSWFDKGPDDPDLTMIKVMPYEGHYWETRNGKLMRIVKMAFSAVIGLKANMRAQGDLKL